MTWVMIYRGNLICLGSFWRCVEEGEEQHILQRMFSQDGTTELAPRIPKGLILIPRTMIESEIAC